MQGFPRPPDPQVTLANWRTSPFNRWAFHHVREIVPSADILFVDRTRGIVVAKVWSQALPLDRERIALTMRAVAGIVGGQDVRGIDRDVVVSMSLPDLNVERVSLRIVLNLHGASPLPADRLGDHQHAIRLVPASHAEKTIRDRLPTVDSPALNLAPPSPARRLCRARHPHSFGANAFDCGRDESAGPASPPEWTRRRLLDVRPTPKGSPKMDGRWRIPAPAESTITI